MVRRRLNRSLPAVAISCTLLYASPALCKKEQKDSLEALAPGASEASPAKPARLEDEHRWSILVVGPVSSAIPYVGLSVEHAFKRRWSAAISGSLGYQRLDYPPWWWSVGAEGRYYVLGGFNHGLPLIVAAEYYHRDVNVVSLAPAAGYKYAFSFGLTFDLSLGIALAYLPDEQRFRSEARPRLGLGWSF